MNRNIIGTLIFRNEGNNCLTSKYFNGSAEGPFTETCKLKEADKEWNDGFCGVYTTVWIEDGHKHVKAELTINRLKNNTYKMKWTKKNNLIFEGIGMLVGDLLVGAYWD